MDLEAYHVSELVSETRYCFLGFYFWRQKGL